ncbi:MAG: putative bifunctional diguanylate cyclase/phosphodiesterase [Acidimicrobiales bacterium]
MNPSIPERTAPDPRDDPRGAVRDLVVNLARPQLSQPRFWAVQAMVVGLFVVHVATSLAPIHHVMPVTDSSVDLLLFIPIVYGGAVFGLVGSLGAALTGIALTIPMQVLMDHPSSELWQEWAVLATTVVVAIQVGHQYEVERRQRELLRQAEHTKVESELRALRLDAEAQRALARRDALFHDAFENNTSGMYLLDRDGTLFDVNRAFCEMIGRSEDELLGRSPDAFRLDDDVAVAEEHRRRLVSGGVSRVHHSTRFVHRDGRVIFGEVSAAGLTDERGEPETIVVSVRDATDERALLAELEHQALYDPLTGLANRTLFEDRLSQARALVARDGGANAVFLLDLDDFKGVNDTFGHHVGDELLVEFARRMERVTRASDTLCRFGGDEFLYLAQGITGSYEEVANRLLGVVREPFTVAGTSLEQRVSIGVVALDDETIDNEELLRDVDTALYEAKRRGKGNVVHFTNEMHDRASSHYELLRDLRGALGTDQLTMKYQPLIDLKADEIVGFEALMRWQHPRRGPVAPDVFIPLAEQTDLIVALGEFALRDATATAASWITVHGRAPYVSVNLSTNQFRDPNLLALVDGALNASALAPHRLVLEVTERVALADSAQVEAVLEHFEHRGVRLALDDFGTGYSSLSHITRLHPHIIKIDRSFIVAAEDDVESRALLEAMISLGRRLHLTVLAEGVETETQRAYLRGLGCELGQGYLFAPALSSDEVATMLRSVSRPRWSTRTVAHATTPEEPSDEVGRELRAHVAQ